MNIITIREGRQTAEGFTATVSIDGQTQYPITVSDPFSGQQERDLEFYFEEWIRFPFDQQVKAQRAAASVKDYGERLFGEVFADADAYSDYKLACRDGLANLRIEIEGESPEFQALHWEALRDPKQPRPFAVDAVFTRKRFQRGIMQINLQPSPVINLLVVTARPDEEKDVGYRTISRPLIDAIEQGRLRVNVELLRPGTFEALSAHLERRAGFYHIVHFDAHGGLMIYDQFVAGAKQSRYLFGSRYGRGDIAPYEGVKAFLFLEGASQGQADPVEAQELADLLTSQGIPICILNACQSGKQVRADAGTNAGADAGTDAGTNAGTDADAANRMAIETRETSLGSRLMTAGVQMVVAMGYSVTVSAAALMMKKLYGELFAAQGIPEAIRLGRKALYNDKNRQVYFNQVVELEDWLLPVVYANKAVDLRLQPFTPEQEAAYYDAQDTRYRFAQPTYSFVGRDLEILKIEKALLRHNVLLLQGMGGTGKTTLLNYLRDWWQTTNFAGEVFYFGYDEKAHTLQQILQAIGKRVLGKFEFATFQAMGLGAQRRKLADVLKAQPYGIVLDNLESVTGEALAIANTLNEAEREEIKLFLQALVGGQTKVVLGSRSDEAWLQDVFSHAGKVNRYQLGGLDAEARTVLAEKILDVAVGNAQQIAALRQEGDFKRLMNLLAGYPLAMEVVLANLGRQSAAAVLAGLDAADVNLDSGAADRTKSILKCVEYSHSNLSAAAQKLLLCLAPFKGFINRADLANYAQQLQQLEPFADWEFDGFDEAVNEAMRWGLLSPYFEGDDGRLLRIQPVFPYFLRAKLAAVDEAVREGLATGFKAHYQGLAAQYQQMMASKEPEQRKLGLFFCGLEYENLYSALENCLEAREEMSILFCLTDYFQKTQNYPAQIALVESVCSALENYPQQFIKSESGYQIAFAFHRLANGYLETKQLPSAREFYQKAVDTYAQLEKFEDRQVALWCATGEHQLGIVAQKLREYEQARSHYQQALDIFIEYNDRYSQARTYHQLGRVAEALREYEQARSHYQQALNICIEYNDRYRQANTYHQLGRVAQELREYEQARSHYQQALDIKIEYNDRYSQASTYHQLGSVAEELREYEQARSHYQQALDICIEYNDRYSQARTYHQLGSVAQELREYEQARSHYQQALDIKIEYNDRYSQASTYHQLGSVAEERREYEQARSHYQQALVTYVEYNDPHNAGIVLRSFSRLYQATQDASLLTEVAQCLNSTVEEVTQLFEQFNQSA